MSNRIIDEVRFALESSDKPLLAREVFELCPAANSAQAVHASLSFLVKKGAVLKHTDGYPAAFELSRGQKAKPRKKVKSKPQQPSKLRPIEDSRAKQKEVPEPAVPAGIDEKPEVTDEATRLAQHQDFLSRSLERAQRTLDEYLAEVADPLILEPLIELRDLANKRLCQAGG